MLSLHEIILRLSLAALLGAAIGIERDLRRRPAGIRTSMFVCLSTALFTILSGEIARSMGDTGSTRIASNIVQGIGFLGAGAILRESGDVIGLTTAATIFVEAAIGMAAGGGLYAVAGYTTVLVLFALVVLGWLAQVAHLKPRVMFFRITTTHEASVAAEVQRLLAGMKINVKHFRVSMQNGKSILEFDADIALQQQERIIQQLHRADVAMEVIPLKGYFE